MERFRKKSPPVSLYDADIRRSDPRYTLSGAGLTSDEIAKISQPSRAQKATAPVKVPDPEQTPHYEKSAARTQGPLTPRSFKPVSDALIQARRQLELHKSHFETESDMDKLFVEGDNLRLLLNKLGPGANALKAELAWLHSGSQIRNDQAAQNLALAIQRQQFIKALMTGTYKATGSIEEPHLGMEHTRQPQKRVTKSNTLDFGEENAARQGLLFSRKMTDHE